MSKRSVLLVDDSPIVRAIVVHALSAHDMAVTTVDDPRAIDGALAAAQPDLLLVDATFPGVTDEMLVEIVERHARSFPVLLFSDRSEAELRTLIERSGAKGFVPKDGATLPERVRSFLGS